MKDSTRMVHITSGRKEDQSLTIEQCRSLFSGIFC